MVDWHPARGGEQAGRRPGLVVSNDLGNRAAPTVIVAALTSQVSPTRYPFQVRVPMAAGTGLTRDSTVNCAQVITIAKDRLGQYIGVLPTDLMREVDAALRVAFGLG